MPNKGREIWLATRWRFASDRPAFASDLLAPAPAPSPSPAHTQLFARSDCEADCAETAKGGSTPADCIFPLPFLGGAL